MTLGYLFRYEQSQFSIEERIEDIITSIISDHADFMTANYINIIDPFLDPSSFFIETINMSPVVGSRDFLSILFDFRDYFPKLESVKIITRAQFSAILLTEVAYKCPPKVIGRRGSYFSVDKFGARFEFLTYRDPGNKPNTIPDCPNLHDRWFLWGNESSKYGMHFGSSFSDFSRKDVTKTAMSAEIAQDANARFIELFNLAKVRA